MLSRFRSAGLVWPTLFAVPALLVLFSLGAWQWQRKTWKEGLLQRLEQERVAQPVSVDKLLPYREADEIRFRRVRLAGTYENDDEFHLWMPGNARQAWRIITPLRLDKPVPRADGEIALTHVLVIRGLVDQDFKQAAQRPDGQKTGNQTVIGRVRMASDNWATPAPNMQANRWYALQPDAMAAELMTRAAKAGDGQQRKPMAVARFLVEAEQAVGPPPAPQPALKQLYLSNRHLEYAVTWWGLGLTLIGVYLFFARGRLQREKP